MQFESSPQTAKAIAIFFASVAFVLLYFVIAVASGAGAVILFLLTVLFSLASYAALNAKYSVTFDSQGSQVEKRFEAIVPILSNQYPVSNFSGVGIGVGGRGGIGAPTAVYFLQLTGRQNLKVSLTSGSRDQTIIEARALADFLRLPLDETPRTVVFNARL